MRADRTNGNVFKAFSTFTAVVWRHIPSGCTCIILELVNFSCFLALKLRHVVNSLNRADVPLFQTQKEPETTRNPEHPTNIHTTREGTYLYDGSVLGRGEVSRVPVPQGRQHLGKRRVKFHLRHPLSSVLGGTAGGKRNDENTSRTQQRQSSTPRPIHWFGVTRERETAMEGIAGCCRRLPNSA